MGHLPITMTWFGPPFDGLNIGDSVSETFNVSSIDGTPATVQITINGTDDAPVITSNGGGINATIAVDEGSTAVTTVTSTDVDNTSAELSYSIVGGDDSAQFDLDASTGVLSFTVAPDYEIPADADGDNEYHVDVQVDDGVGGIDTQSITVVVQDVDENGPVIADTTLTLAENSANGTNVFNVDDSVTGIDQDPDGDAISYTITGGNALGAFAIDSTTGQITVASSAPLDAETNPTFTLTVEANAAGSTNTGQITINLVDVDESAAVVTGSFTGNVDEADPGDVSTTTGTLAISDADVDDSPEFVDAASAPGSNGYGSFVLSAGTWTYTLNQNAVQNLDAGDSVVDSITYAATDGSSQTVSVTISGTNDAPILSGGSSASFAVIEGTTSVASFSASDVDANDTRTFEISGTDASRFDMNGSNLVFNNAPDFENPSDANADNTYELIVTTIDSQGASDSQSVTVVVTDADENVAPIANDDAADVDAGNSVEVDVLSNDDDPDGDPLIVLSATADHGSTTITDAGAVNYTPDDGFSGVDSVTYTISDGRGGTDTARITVTVVPVNTPPTAINDLITIEEDSNNNSIDVLANDDDADGDLLQIVGAEAQNGTVTISDDGRLLYTPDADFHGVDTITYEIADGNDGSDAAIVEVTVTPVNVAPIAADDIATVDQDSSNNLINVLSNDVDADGDLLDIVAASANNGTVSINAAGSISYTPNPDYNGADVISYTVSDVEGETATANVTVTVVNAAPDAQDDAAIVEEDSITNTIEVLGNDSDREADQLTILSAAAEHGDVSINDDGSLSYSPETNYSGPETITYTIGDGQGGEDSAQVLITVTPSNDAPEAQNDVFSTIEDTPLTISVTDLLNNDEDIDGDNLNVDVGPPANGTVDVNGDGTFTYTPSLNFVGEDSFVYTVSDSEGATDTATVFVNVVDDGIQEVDLSLAISVNNATPNVGESVTVSIVVTNDGPDTATNVVVTNILQTGLDFVDGDSTVGSFDAGSNDWLVGELGAGESETLELRLSVTLAQTFVNVAEVIAVDQIDNDSIPGNDDVNEDDRVSVVIQGQPIVVDSGPGTGPSEPPLVDDDVLTDPATDPSPIVGGGDSTPGTGGSTPGTTTSVDLTPTIPDTPPVTNIFNDADEVDPLLNPITLSGNLSDQTVTEGIMEFVISDGEFTHTEDTPLEFEALLPSGQPFCQILWTSMKRLGHSSLMRMQPMIPM